MITEACGTKREGADPCTCGNRLFCFANFQAALATRDIRGKGVRLAAGLRKGRLCAEASNNDLSPARSGDTNKGSVPSPVAAGVRGDEFMGEVAPPCYPAICGPACCDWYPAAGAQSNGFLPRRGGQGQSGQHGGFRTPNPSLSAYSLARSGF